ncbi:hypothetical protein [Aeromicrobium piscarium]|uniref:LPXTG cell wall anchor domain-containing protein n=1 Tax=Aeromicrobium piscarium TaxID=2590901 RepID=A0A554RX45_9ACTN|nr:hypothetical protein [Aeromicrobium piscarium]TSD58679.1 hypothetical protein FNM00_13550 [Aeromicrobium piscarium]
MRQHVATRPRAHSSWRRLSAAVGGAALAVTALVVPSMAADDPGTSIEVWGGTTASIPGDESWSQVFETSTATSWLVADKDDRLRVLPGSSSLIATPPAAVTNGQVRDAVVVGSGNSTAALAVTDNGALHRWGASSSRQMPNGTWTSADLGGQGAAVTASTLAALVTLADGGLVRVDSFGAEAIERDGQPLTGVAQTTGVSYVRLADGTVGRIGTVGAEFGQFVELRPAGDDPVIDISAYYAVTESGEVLRLATSGLTPERNVPEVQGTIVSAQAAGSVTAALTDRGQVVVWRPDGTAPAESFTVPGVVADGTTAQLFSTGGSAFAAWVEHGDGSSEPPIEVTQQPSIAGSPQVGETLSVDTPAVFDPAEGVEISHQWWAAEADGDPALLEGETGDSLELTDAHEGMTITYTASGQRGEETPVVTERSNGIGPIEPAEQPGDAGVLQAWGNSVERIEADGTWRDIFTSRVAGAWFIQTSNGLHVIGSGPFAQFPVALTNATFVDAAIFNTAIAWGVTDDGSVHSWGQKRPGQIPNRSWTAEDLGGEAVAIGGGQSSGVAILDGGALVEITGTGVQPVTYDGSAVTNARQTVLTTAVLLDNGAVGYVQGAEFTPIIAADADDPVVEISANVAVTESGKLYDFVQGADATEVAGVPDDLDGTPIRATRAFAAYTVLTDAGEIVTWRPDGADLTENQQVPPRISTGEVKKLLEGAPQQMAVWAIEGPEPPITVTQQPEIAGEPEVGATLTVETPAEFSPAEGVEVTHQWWGSLDDGEPVLLPETSDSLELTSEHRDMTITYTASGQRGDEEPVVSERSNEIGPIVQPPLPDLEADTVPEIAVQGGGEPRVNATIEATPAEFSPADGVQVQHRWYRDGDRIDGANASTYTLAADDIDASITYRSHAVRPADDAELTSDESNAIGPVLPVILEITSAPQITGDGYIGQEHTVIAGETTDDTAVNTFQWTVTFDDDREPVTVDGDTFTPGEDHRGGSITVTQTATRESDGATDSETSAAVGPVRDEPVEVTIESPATIEGTPRVGQTVTGTAAQFSVDDVPAQHYWVIDGVQSEPVTVNAQGQATLTLTKADHERKSIRFRSIATPAELEPVTSTSVDAVGPVLVDLAAVSNPTIAGTPEVGQELSIGTDAVFSDTHQSVTVTYRWLVGDQQVGTGRTLTLTGEHVGAQIVLEATATRGTETATATSDATAAVQPRPGGPVAEIKVENSPVNFAKTAIVHVGTDYAGQAVQVWVGGITMPDLYEVSAAGKIEVKLPGELGLGEYLLVVYGGEPDEAGNVSSLGSDTFAITLPPPGDDTPQGDVDGPDSVTQGQTVDFYVGTQFAGQQVRIGLHSTPRDLGLFTVGEDGFVRGITIPADMEVGAHQIAFYDMNGDFVGWQALEITERVDDGGGNGPGGNGPGGDLPGTGATSPEYLGPIGLAVLLAGAVTMGAAWRRRVQMTS